MAAIQATEPGILVAGRLALVCRGPRMATGPEQLGKEGWRAERRPQGPGREDGGRGGRECTKQLLKPGEGAKAKGGLREHVLFMWEELKSDRCYLL